MNPNPRSETIFFTVPFGLPVLLLSNTELNASALFEREECRPHARSPEGRANGRTLPHSPAGGQNTPMSWYSLLKFVHVLLAITAVGSNITYAAWNARGAREPQHLAFALRGIQFLDNRVANPAYGLLLLTGLILVAGGNWGLRGWIIAALILFVVLIIVAVGFYSRVAKRQIEALDASGESSPVYQQLAGQARVYGIVSAVIALAIVFLMVVKPFP